MPLSGPIPGIDSTSDYLVYYATWDSDNLFRAKDFDLVILEPSAVTAQQVAELRAGHDGVLGTDDDVIVIGYISIGEDEVGNHVGDGRGPCYYDWDGDSIVYTNNGYASWYVDDADHNGLPDRNGTWGSYYVNAGDSAWWEFVEAEADAIFAKGMDGLFLDTIDTASPCSWGVPYCWTKEGMSNLIAHLRELYPDKILIQNRGLFFFDPSMPDYYALNTRHYINGLMFESYYLEWDWGTNTAHVSPWFSQNRTYWAPRVNNEAHQPDGFTVFALDYINLNQANHDELLSQQIYYTIEEQGWVDYVSHPNLDVIRYDVFHSHPDGDRNPPTWNTTIGLMQAEPSGTSVTLKWNDATDQTPPVQFNVYYSDQPFSDPSQATKLEHVNAEPDNVYAWRYTVEILSPNTTYYFMVRAEDSATPAHEDHNMRILEATTGGGGSSQGIVIDGDFSDWAYVPQLDAPPNPVENGGDAENPDADLVDLWCTNDTEKLYISYSLLGSYTPSNYYYHVFLDTDRSNSTGFVIGSIGADFMVENNNLFRYSGTGGGWGWTQIAGIEFASSGGRVEMSIRLDSLQISVGESLNMIFNINRGVAPYDALDYAPDDWENESYTYGGTAGIEERECRKFGSSIKFDASRKTVIFCPPEPSVYQIVLYDSSGRRLRTIFEGFLDGTEDFNLPKNLPNGIYWTVFYGRTGVMLKSMPLLVVW